MRRFPKTWFRLSIMALMLVLIVGCAAKKPNQAAVNSNGSNATDPKTVTIDFLYWEGVEGEAYKELFKAFEQKYPNIKINPQPVPGSGDVLTKLQTRVAGNDAPDVIRMTYPRFGYLASQGVLQDLSDFLSKDKDKYLPSLLEGVTYNGKIYGLPHHSDTEAILYNKTVLDKLNIKVPSKPEEAWTWDQLMDIMQKIKDSKSTPYQMVLDWNTNSPYRLLYYLAQNKASLLTDDLKKGNLETPEAIETLAFLKKMFSNYMPEGNSIKGSVDKDLLFTSGKTAFYITGHYKIPKLETEIKDFEWGVTYMPVKKVAASNLGGSGLAIPTKAKHPEEAKKFIAFLAEKENMKSFVEKTTFIPSRTDIGPLDYQIKRKELMNVFLEQMKTVPPVIAKTYSVPEFAKINVAIGDSLEEMLKLGASPEDTAKNLDKNINELLNAGKK